MRVLAAPRGEDPRDGGLNNCVPGELLCRPAIVCDAGRANSCGCERTWHGTSSRKGTTLAEVADRPDLDHSTYLATIGLYLIDAYSWEYRDAYAEATMLADLAASFDVGDHITIGLDDDGESHVFDVLEHHD